MCVCVCVCVWRGGCIEEGGRKKEEGERLKKRQEDRFTDTQTDGEKGRDAKRQTRADGEGRGQDEPETDGQRDPGPGKCRETQRACLSNTLRKI